MAWQPIEDANPNEAVLGGYFPKSKRARDKVLVPYQVMWKGDDGFWETTNEHGYIECAQFTPTHFQTLEPPKRGK